MIYEQCSELPAVVAARSSIESEGFYLSDEATFMGTDRKLRERCISAFADGLQADYVNFHPDRQRLRNVYQIGHPTDGRIELTEVESISIENRNIGGKREYTRANFLGVEYFGDLLTRLFHALPEEDRKKIRLIEVDYMQTRSVVTNTIHRDFRDYVSIFCLQKHGVGAKTHLYLDPDGKSSAYERELTPGELLLFRDEDFYHFTTDLVADSEDSLRDVFIIIFGD